MKRQRLNELRHKTRILYVMHNNQLLNYHRLDKRDIGEDETQPKDHNRVCLYRRESFNKSIIARLCVTNGYGRSW